MAFIISERLPLPILGFRLLRLCVALKLRGLAFFVKGHSFFFDKEYYTLVLLALLGSIDREYLWNTLLEYDLYIGCSLSILGTCSLR